MILDFLEHLGKPWLTVNGRTFSGKKLSDSYLKEILADIETNLASEATTGVQEDLTERSLDDLLKLLLSVCL